jgi:hypothetical protein
MRSPENRSSRAKNALVVSRLTSPENGRSLKNVVARLAADSTARPNSVLGAISGSRSTTVTIGADSFRMLRLI